MTLEKPRAIRIRLVLGFITPPSHLCAPVRKLTGASNSLPETTANLSCPWKSFLPMEIFPSFGPGLCPQEGGGWWSCRGRARSIPTTHERFVPRHSHRHPGDTINALIDGTATGQMFYQRKRAPGRSTHGAPGRRSSPRSGSKLPLRMGSGRFWPKNEITRRPVLVFLGCGKLVRSAPTIVRLYSAKGWVWSSPSPIVTH